MIICTIKKYKIMGASLFIKLRYLFRKHVTIQKRLKIVTLHLIRYIVLPKDTTSNLHSINKFNIIIGGLP